MISIVIPAHNEEASIARCLDRLLADGNALQRQIIVVCNGCSDRTAEIARQFGGRVIVIETDVASKVHALNLGDDVATGFPRFYMDADVILSPDDLQAIANVLTDGPILAASPRMQMDFSNASWAVRAFYQVWMTLPYTQLGMMGVGVYALSETGRRRFDRFPNVIADDGYIRILYKPQERKAVNEAVSIVKAPATLADLIKIKSRSRLGVYELQQRYPELFQNDDKSYGSAIWNVLAKPLLWPCIPAYLYVNLIAKRRAGKQLQKLDGYVWERDESSRRT
jgi:glycosyltransferase involved in cell wall biosynthesis